MKAVMLAAGVGNRLFGDDGTQLPKALIRLNGKSLLQRHIENLIDLGVEELVLVCGYHMDELVAEAESRAPPGFVRPLLNPDFREGSVVSLWTACDELRSGADILLMDADVLYDSALLRCLVEAPEENCILLDRAIEDGDEPVKICVLDGELVDFGKIVEGDFDFIGEWPGFLRASPHVAARLAEASEAYIKDGRREAICELAIRDALLSVPRGTFQFVDITGIPWIEIDFPTDLDRARDVILPQIDRNGRGPD